MLFKDIPGKEDEKRFLINSVKENRLPHAQLFLGRPGSGQLALALAYSRYIMCKDRQDDDSCGDCSSCHKYDRYIHPDFHFAFPVVKKDGLKRKETTSNDYLGEWRRAICKNPYMDMDFWISELNLENQQPDINTQECINIVHKLSLQSFESTYKIVIIWMPEYLGKEGNRLLKLIEEPTDDTLILLVTENSDRILNTILSRTQLIKIKPFTDEQVADYLTHHTDLSVSAAQEVAKISSGNMSQALAGNFGDDLNYSDLFLKWIKIAYTLDPEPINRWINDIQKQGRENQKSFLKYAIYIIGNYLRKSFRDSHNIAHLVDDKLLVALNDYLTIEIAESLIHLFNESIMHISRNVNSKIVFMTLSTSMGRMMRSKTPLSELFSI